ncbi:MAG: TRAP transporter large permease subunit [Acidobacteria bacterium]|nr:TRAP transporter large permease subunit [Acidobacteriota bacterium]
MDPGLAAGLCIVSMVIFLVLGVPIAFALGFSATVFGTLAFGPMALYKMGLATFSLFYNYSWTPLPLFVLMACVITETAIGKDLYKAARNWVSGLPGALVSASILGEALMASTVGVSGAAIVAVGKVAEPELDRYGYDRKLALGGMMCGGVLGPLIPPSTPLIIYGVIANVSVGHLLIAGIIPGALLALMLAAVPILICWRNPKLGPAAGSVNWVTRLGSLKNVWPVIAVLTAIIGSIFFGIATPTEAAGIGCVVIIIIAVTVFRLRWKGLYRAMVEAAVINAMMLVIIVAASFFSYMLASAGVGDFLSNLVLSLNVPPKAIVIAIMVLYLILGSLFDSITITMLTIPIFAPLLTALGFDLVWFGILYVVNLEIGLITPPMGVNLFFVRNVFNIKTGDLLKGAAPFLITLTIFLFILLFVPGLSLWLPEMMAKL